MTQVTLDASFRRRVEGYVGAANGNDQPLSVTVAAANSTLVVFATSSVSAVTYNGVALTKIGETDTSNTSNYQSAWGLINPAVGTHSLVITKAGTGTDVLVEASVWANTDQTTLFTSAPADIATFWLSGRTVACTIPAGGIGVCALNATDQSPPGGNTVTALSGQTLLGQQDAVTHLAASYSATAGSAALGFAWTTGDTQQSATQLIVTLGPVAAASVDLTAANMSGGSTIATGAVSYTAPPAGTNLVAAAMSGGSTIATGAITYAAPTVKVTTDAFTAWGDPTPLASLTVPHTSVSALDGTFIAHFAGAVTDSNGKLTLIHGALVSGSSYAVSNWDATGANRGCKIYQAV